MGLPPDRSAAGLETTAGSRAITVGVSDTGFLFSAAAGFHEGNCYSTIQGTSMAAPHVAASLALVASAHKSLRKHPGALLARLKGEANDNPTNFTRALSATDTSPGDLTGLPCDIGYCHPRGRGSPMPTPTGPGWSTWPTRSTAPFVAGADRCVLHRGRSGSSWSRPPL